MGGSGRNKESGPEPYTIIIRVQFLLASPSSGDGSASGTAIHTASGARITN